MKAWLGHKPKKTYHLTLHDAWNRSFSAITEAEMWVAAAKQRVRGTAAAVDPNMSSIWGFQVINVFGRMALAFLYELISPDNMIFEFHLKQGRRSFERWIPSSKWKPFCGGQRHPRGQSAMIFTIWENDSLALFAFWGFTDTPTIPNFKCLK